MVAHTALTSVFIKVIDKASKKSPKFSALTLLNVSYIFFNKNPMDFSEPFPLFLSQHIFCFFRELESCWWTPLTATPNRWLPDGLRMASSLSQKQQLFDAFGAWRAMLRRTNAAQRLERVLRKHCQRIEAPEMVPRKTCAPPQKTGQVMQSDLFIPKLEVT